MHSNASVTSAGISISQKMLTTFAQFTDEILAIVAHEIGHYKLNHIFWLMTFDVLIVVIFAAILPFIYMEPGFLIAFGFSQKSYFASLAMFIWLWSVTLDIPLQLLFKSMRRR